MTPLPSYRVMWTTRKMATMTLQNEPHTQHNRPQTSPHEARTPTKPKRGPSGAIWERWVQVNPKDKCQCRGTKLRVYNSVNGLIRLLDQWMTLWSMITINKPSSTTSHSHQNNTRITSQTYHLLHCYMYS